MLQEAISTVEHLPHFGSGASECYLVGKRVSYSIQCALRWQNEQLTTDSGFPHCLTFLPIPLFHLLTQFPRSLTSPCFISLVQILLPSRDHVLNLAVARQGPWPRRPGPRIRQALEAHSPLVQYARQSLCRDWRWKGFGKYDG